ncbi:MAG: hypothetical protein O3C60_06140, partial [Planctomycetota bacterium]|nr:hypothetical protein [Planctomycetota bacterium]
MYRFELESESVFLADRRMGQCMSGEESRQVVHARTLTGRSVTAKTWHAQGGSGGAAKHNWKSFLAIWFFFEIFLFGFHLALRLSEQG